MSTEAALKAKWNAYYSNAMDRFWSRVDQSGGPDACWPWTGCTKPGGYGFIMHKRRARLTHRVALSGSLDVQPGMMACHSCDNPICRNPAHLFWGTAQDNSDDCSAKGRKRGAPRIIDVDELVRRRDGGASYSVLADFFGVNQSSIAKALKRHAILRAKLDGTAVNKNPKAQEG